LSDDHHTLEAASRGAESILDNGLVRVGTLVAGLFLAISLAFSLGAWFTKTNLQLTSLQNEIVAMRKSIEKNTEDRWRRADMIQFCRETELTNQNWKCGDLSR
jgi:hypothetical protein